MPEIKTVKPAHEVLIDLLLIEPQVTTAELAALSGYTSGWVSSILSSDAFQVRLAQRRSALIDPIITRSIKERLNAVAISSLDSIQTRLNNEHSAQFALDALDLATSGATKAVHG